MTDGMLFRETLIDPLLSRYSVIMVSRASLLSAYAQWVSRLTRRMSEVFTQIYCLVS